MEYRAGADVAPVVGKRAERASRRRRVTIPVVIILCTRSQLPRLASFWRTSDVLKPDEAK